MNRRSFFGRLSQAVAGAVLAAHIDLGNLIPLPAKELFDAEFLPQPPLYDIYAVATCRPFQTLFEVPIANEDA